MMTLFFLMANSGEVSYMVKIVCTFLAVVNGVASYGMERRLLMRVHTLELALSKLIKLLEVEEE